ncbi:17710_t:CDS:1, partial [Cetraspora pellucida]
MSCSKEEIEKEFQKLCEIKKKVKNEDIMLFMSFCSLTFGNIEEIIERETTREEKDFLLKIITVVQKILKILYHIIEKLWKCL